MRYKNNLQGEIIDQGEPLPYDRWWSRDVPPKEDSEICQGFDFSLQNQQRIWYLRNLHRDLDTESIAGEFCWSAYTWGITETKDCRAEIRIQPFSVPDLLIQVIIHLFKEGTQFSENYRLWKVMVWEPQ